MDLSLIKRDFRELRSYVFGENDINDWDRLIIIYNLYLFFNHLYILYALIDYISKDKNQSFLNQFKNIYLFFFILCNVRTSYFYFIYNVAKINKNLSDSFYKNTKEYFI